jgi:hypothetical protein
MSWAVAAVGCQATLQVSSCRLAAGVRGKAAETYCLMGKLAFL